MTIRQLQYFSAVYEYGSVLKAAEALYISHQALARTIDTLEKEIRISLFVRSRKGMFPTEFGSEFYTAARKVIADMAELESFTSNYARAHRRSLRVGIAAGARYFPAKYVWKIFCDQEQNIQLDICANECHYEEGLSALQNGQLDVLIFSDYQADEPYKQVTLRTWKRAVIVPEGHPLKDKEHIFLDDLKDQIIAASANPLFYNRFQELCAEKNCAPAEIIRVSDALYVYEICNLDHCLGLTIDEYFTQPFLSQFPNLLRKPIECDELAYSITTLSLKTHPLSRVIDHLSAYLKDYLQSKFAEIT